MLEILKSQKSVHLDIHLGSMPMLCYGLMSQVTVIANLYKTPNTPARSFIFVFFVREINTHSKPAQRGRQVRCFLPFPSLIPRNLFSGQKTPARTTPTPFYASKIEIIIPSELGIEVVLIVIIVAMIPMRHAGPNTAMPIGWWIHDRQRRRSRGFCVVHISI